jgi:pilus assembly protein CpaB
MGRRTILLIVAAMVAVAGAGLVYLYVQGADDRAKEAQAPVTVLKAVAQIEPGETLAAASEAGKIELRDVPAEQQLDGAMATIGESGALVALTRIYPNEQITGSKFGSPGEQDNLTVPAGKFAVSVNLSDTGRVAGFVSPGSRVAIFLTGTEEQGSKSTYFTRLLLPEVQVIAVAQTTVSSTTTTTDGGAQTTETLPRTLFTLAVDQDEAERILFASGHGELSFGLLDDKSKVAPGEGVTARNLFG